MTSNELVSSTAGNKNLKRLLAVTLDCDISEGRMAYQRYHNVMRRFADHYGAGFVPTVEAFVALSPNNDYHGNLRSLASVLNAYRTNKDNFTISTYRACGQRALNYLRGETSFLDTVGGPKIRAFRSNILYPQTSNEITVDGHMVAAWQGADFMTMKQAAAVLKNKTNYAKISSGIRSVARSAGMRPCAMQATLWITRKRTLGVKLPSQYDLFYGADDLAKTDCHPIDFPPFGEREARHAAS